MKASHFPWFTRVLATALSAVLVVHSAAWPALDGFQPQRQDFITPDLPSTLELLDYYPPSSLARVTDSFLSTSDRANEPSSRRLVLLIQDLHCHPDVQRKISQLLEHYDSKGIGTGFVAAEGAEGPVDLSPIALFPDEKIKKAVTEEFVDKGLFSGVERYAILNGRADRLRGVEDKSAYQLHRKIFRESWEGRMRLAREIERFRYQLEALEPSVFSITLMNLKNRARDHESGKTGPLEYLAHLRRLAKSSEVPYPPELSLFEATLRMENAVSTRRLKQEVRSFLPYLQPKLKPFESNRLAVYAKENSTVYYLYLHNLARKYQVLDHCPKNLKDFMLVQDRMGTQDLAGVQEKSDKLLHDLLLRKANTKAQALLIQYERDLALTERLLGCELTEDELKEIFLKKDHFLAELQVFLKSQGKSAFQSSDPAALAELFAQAFDFYSLAISRELPMAERTLECLTHSESRSTILVTGGFHSRGIAQILKEKNISYLVLSPQVEFYTEEDRDRYWNVILGRAPALESGSRTALAPELGSAATSAGLAAAQYRLRGGMPEPEPMKSNEVSRPSARWRMAHWASLLFLPSFLPVFVRNLGRRTRRILVLPFTGGFLAASALVSAFLPTPSHAQSAYATNAAFVSWSPNASTNLAGYKVYVGERAGFNPKDPLQSSVVNVGKATSYSVRGLLPNKEYFFTVTAYNTSGLESAPAPQVSYFVPPPAGFGVAYYLPYNFTFGSDDLFGLTYVSMNVNVRPGQRPILESSTDLQNWTVESPLVTGRGVWQQSEQLDLTVYSENLQPAQFFRVRLPAILFYVGLGLGALFLSMDQNTDALLSFAGLLTLGSSEPVSQKTAGRAQSPNLPAIPEGLPELVVPEESDLLMANRKGNGFENIRRATLAQRFS